LEYIENVVFSYHFPDVREYGSDNLWPTRTTVKVLGIVKNLAVAMIELVGFPVPHIKFPVTKIFFPVNGIKFPDNILREFCRKAL
jgi:hypothetical protein